MTAEATETNEQGASATPQDGGAEAGANVETAVEVPAEFLGEDGQADIAKLVGKIAELSEAGKSAAPETPDAYELTFGDKLKDKDGNVIALDDKHPLIPEFRKAAHEAGLDQAQFSAFAKLYAEAELAREQTRAADIEAAGQAEIAKLGDNAKERIRGVDAFLIAQLGDKVAAGLIETLTSAAAYSALEALSKKFTANRAPDGASQAEQHGGKSGLTLAERIYGVEQKQQ